METATRAAKASVAEIRAERVEGAEEVLNDRALALVAHLHFVRDHP